MWSSTQRNWWFETHRRATMKWAEAYHGWILGSRIRQKRPSVIGTVGSRAILGAILSPDATWDRSARFLSPFPLAVRLQGYNGAHGRVTRQE